MMCDANDNIDEYLKILTGREFEYPGGCHH